MLEASKASDLKDSSTHGKPDAWLLEVLYAHMHAKNLVQTTDCEKHYAARRQLSQGA